MILKFAIFQLKYRKWLGRRLGKLITFLQFRSNKKHTAISRINSDKKNLEKSIVLENHKSIKMNVEINY